MEFQPNSDSAGVLNNDLEEPMQVGDVDDSWIKMKQIIPEGESKIGYIPIEHVAYIYQTPSTRYIVDISKDNTVSGELTIYVSDRITKELHSYGATQLTVSICIGCYLLSDTLMVVMEHDQDNDRFMQYFVLLDHTQKVIVPLASYYYAADLDMDDVGITAMPLVIDCEAYCVLIGDGLIQVIPFLPRTNLLTQPKIPLDFRIEIEPFRLGNYNIRKEDPSVCGSKLYLMVAEEYLAGGDDRFIVDKIACVDLAKYDMKGTVYIDQNNCDNVEIIDLKKTNFTTPTLENLSFFSDDQLLVYGKEEQENCFSPCYAVNLVDLTVTKMETIPGNYGVPLRYQESSFILTRFTERHSQLCDELENVFEYKIIRYKVPRLSELCSDSIILNDLTKQMSDSELKMLFN